MAAGLFVAEAVAEAAAVVTGWVVAAVVAASVVAVGMALVESPQAAKIRLRQLIRPSKQAIFRV